MESTAKYVNSRKVIQKLIAHESNMNSVQQCTVRRHTMKTWERIRMWGGNEFGHVPGANSDIENKAWERIGILRFSHTVSKT